MEQPLVSILTVTRNRGNLLRRCIQSVLSQTYTNIEHIVVDGASEDNTDDVIKEFNDGRLKFIKLDSNWPLKKTFDYGISLCKGKYIAFLDSDDEYLPTKIEKEVNLLESLPEDYGMVYCWMTYYDTSRNNAVDHVHKAEIRGNVKDVVVGGPLISGTPTLLFRLDFFKQIGGWKSPDEIGIASDWEMCARACQLTKVDFVPESLVNVYVNHGSVRQSDDLKYYEDAYKRNIKFHKYFLNQFADNFKRSPRQAAYHYFFLARYNYKLKNYGSFLRYIFKAFILKPKATLNKFNSR